MDNNTGYFHGENALEEKKKGGSKHLENLCSDMNSSGFWASASIITLCATYSISCSYSLHNVLHLVCVCE